MNFGIKRLLLAVTAFAVAFGAFSYLGVAGIVVSSMIGFSVGIICLIIKPIQTWPMIRTGTITIAGGFIGFMFCPMAHPPYSPGDEFGYIGFGGFIGFAIAISWSAYQQSKTKPSVNEPENTE